MLNPLHPEVQPTLGILGGYRPLLADWYRKTPPPLSAPVPATGAVPSVTRQEWQAAGRTGVGDKQSNFPGGRVDTAGWRDEAEGDLTRRKIPRREGAAMGREHADLGRVCELLTLQDLLFSPVQPPLLLSPQPLNPADPAQPI